jgi:hypothetical protein
LPFSAAIRLGAVYGCKYAAKDWSEEVLAGGAHRYEVAQGFQPKKRTYDAATIGEAVGIATSFFGARYPDAVWGSDEVEDWPGPPTWCLTWIDWPGFGAGTPDG